MVVPVAGLLEMMAVMQIDRVKLGRAIRLARVQSSLKQKELAQKCCISANYLSLLEAGKRGVSIDGLNALARAMRVSAAMLLFLAEDPQSLPDDLAKRLSESMQRLVERTFLL